MKPENLWINEFGNKNVAKDFAGREIRKKEYGTNSPYAWDIDHIQPKLKNGKDGVENLQIVNKITNDEKGEKTTFSIKGITYQVKKAKNADKEEWANYNYTDKKYCVCIMGNK